MRSVRRSFRALIGALLPLAGIVVVADSAAAVHVACGQTITTNTLLDSNIGPCSGTGIRIGANNITLDLGGFTISGTPVPGEGPGVTMVGRTGVTVKNGTIIGFDAGVAITGGSGNTVSRLRLLDNRGDFSTDFGDGIAVFNSTGNTIDSNLVNNSGPYDGIGLIRSEGNIVTNNQVTNNNMSANSTAGIRLENLGFAASNRNIVGGNTVSNSATFGIQVFAGGSDNVIKNNTVIRSGLRGITLFAGSQRNKVELNVLRQNGAFGIWVQAAAGSFGPATNNQLLRNQSYGHTTADLRDLNPECDANVWSGNQAATGLPACTLNP